MLYSFNQQAVKKSCPSHAGCGKGGIAEKGRGREGGTKGLTITTF